MRLTAGLIVLGTVAVLLSGCGSFSSAELQRQVDGVASISSEGHLLADEVAGDSTRQSFVRVHASDLAEQMDHTEAKLRETQEEKEVPSDLQDPVDQTVELASEVSDALGVLELNPGDVSQARQASEKLSAFAEKAHELSERL
jgi:enhancing lycopene biosynthesis protein 2